MATKTDNHNPGAKLELRRHFLRKYHDVAAGAPAPRVFDCCQATGKLWGQLRTEFQLGGYWGVDMKPKAGRLKIDSVRVLECPGWTEDVIDVDTYGSPWKHWQALLPNLHHAATVFLTLGLVSAPGGGGGVGTAALRAAGLDRFPTMKLPTAFEMKMADVFPRYCIGLAWDHALRVVEAVESVNDGGNARYFGVRLEPAV